MTKEALRCNYCGGYVNPQTYYCEYCGTQYIKPKSRVSQPHEVMVVKYPAPFEVIAVQKKIPLTEFRQMRDIGIQIEEHIRRDFADKIAKAIADKIEIYEDFNIDVYKKTYSARLRVVNPDFRF